MSNNAMAFEVDLRAITVEVFQEVDALLAEIEREREQGVLPFTGGIVPPCPDQLAHLFVDGVISRRLVESMSAWRLPSPPITAGPILVETRVYPRSFDEVREVDRALVRRDRATARQVAEKLSRPRVSAREVADRLEMASKITSTKES